jgi:hypothetical protein
VANKVDKDIKAGISVVKGFIRVPMSKKTRLYVHSDCFGLRQEMGLYKYNKDAAGNYLDDPHKADNHSCDALRYCIYTLFGKARGNLHYAKDIPNIPQNKIVQVLPKGAEVSGIIGRTIIDNKHILDKKKDNENSGKRNTSIKFDFLDIGDFDKKNK